MRHGKSIGEGARGRRPARRGGGDRVQPILRIVVRGDEDLTLIHRRTRQVSALLAFSTSQQTQIGLAIAEMVGTALKRAAAAKLEFSLRADVPSALCVSIRDGGPPRPDRQRSPDENLSIRIARHLMDDVQIELSASGGTKVTLRRLLPAESPALNKERIGEIRDHLASCVPKPLVQELREQNRELRKVQRDLVVSELSLRRRIRQNALLTEVAVVLMGTESIAGKLQRCAEEIVEHLGIECALIWRADPPEAMTLAASAGLCGDDVPPPANWGHSPLSLIRRERRPYATPSVLEELQGADREWAIRQQIQAFAGYPLTIDDRFLGVLGLYSREPPEPDALDTLALVASQIALGMERLERLEERERLLASEHEARVKAERATRMRDHLLAIVAHDLRNPLSAIVTSTALLKRIQVPGEDLRWRKHLQAITNSVERMNRLILDLLDIASIEAGRLALQLTRQSISSLIHELLEHHSPIAEGKGLRFEAQDESLVDISADRGRILQAMFNLLDNAFKFTPAGGIISVHAIRRSSDAILAVMDTGPGIAEADRAHVFESYWQANPRSGVGLGLGLSISKAIVEAHRGRIWFESAEGRGTTFFVSLPAVVSLPALAESAADEARLAP